MIGTVGPKGQVTKWVSLAAGIWVQALAGHANVFANYSTDLKGVLQINQVQLNNLGVAKDFGDSVGLLAGGLVNILPTWVILLIGAIECFVGYGLVWLVMSGTIAPLPYWQMVVVLCLAANSSTWLNTAVLVTSMRNFSTNRGTVVGIIKGFIGLSGAVFTQFFVTLLREDPRALVLFLALGPPLICMAVMYFIRPVTNPDGAPPYYDPREHIGFKFIHVVCISLALYLFVSTLSDSIIKVTPLMSKIMLAVLLVFLGAPFLVPAKFLFDKRTWKAVNNREHSVPFDLNEEENLPPSIAPGTTDLNEPLLKSNDKKGGATRTGVAAGGTPGQVPVSSEGSKRRGPESVSPRSPMSDRSSKQDSASFICMAPNNPDIEMECDDSTLLAVGEGALRRRRRGPHRGEDFTLSEALVKADFWLLFLTFFCGIGTGATIINNLGQIGLAQGYSDVTMFVSLFSVWNFLGRLGAGSVSEHYVRSSAMPRTVWMLVAQVIMIITHLLFASALPGSLHVGSMLLGISTGMHIAIMVPVASELFGLANFGVIYNFLNTGIPFGSLLFSGVLAGYIYDREAEKQQEQGGDIHNIMNFTRFLNSPYYSQLFKDGADDASSICLGAHCFRTTFFIMAVIMLFGLGMNGLLTRRIWPVYRSLYSRQNSSTNVQDGEEQSHQRRSHH
ncbi:hypothetical protein R1sor_002954 [Riccia sorocarpa]|uniref:Nodulin-like domain-containing protein n=1 Tax=Riccia sorocarpa TaxID=122646 RepID=A0ABD3H091_9MARC